MEGPAGVGVLVGGLDVEVAVAVRVVRGVRVGETGVVVLSSVGVVVGVVVLVGWELGVSVGEGVGGGMRNS